MSGTREETGPSDYSYAPIELCHQIKHRLRSADSGNMHMPSLTLPPILTSRSRSYPPLLPHSMATPVCPFLRWVTEISSGTVREKRDSSSSAIMAGCRGEPSLETASRCSSRAGRVALWETVQGCGFDSKQQSQMTKARKYSPISITKENRSREKI